MSSRGSSQSTRQDRSRRRRAVVVIVVAAVLIGGWIAVIAMLAGGGEEGSGPQQPPQQAGTPDEAEGGGDAGAGEQAADGSDGNGSANNGSGNSSGGPSEEELEEVADEALSEPPGGGVPEGEVPIEDEEGRSNGQRGFVSSFIGAAYGYTGSDVEEYRAGYENRIDTSTYYDSEGGAVLEEYAAMVEDGGAENAAVLKDYRISSGEAVETEVDAAELEQFAPTELMQSEVPEGATLAEVTYAVGNRYGDTSKDEDFGDVYGDVDYLKQRLFLTGEDGSGLTLVAASAPERTQDPFADRLPPGANKVAEPQGPGIPDHGHDH